MDTPEDNNVTRLNPKPSAKRMGDTLADLVRQIMRASASDSSSQSYKAMATLDNFLDLCADSEGVMIGDVITRAIQDLTVEAHWSSTEGDRVNTAQKGMRFLIESSCNDAAARGRASRRWDEFLNAYRFMEEMRECRAAKFRGDVKGWGDLEL